MTLQDEKFLNNYLSGHLLCLLLCYTARNSSPGHCLFLGEGKLRGFTSFSMLNQPWLTSSRETPRAATEKFCGCTCRCPPITVVCRAQCISSRRIPSSCFQRMMSRTQICSQSRKLTYSSICQIAFNNVRVWKVFNTNFNHVCCQGEKTLERSIEAWFPCTSQSLSPSLSFASWFICILNIIIFRARSQCMNSFHIYLPVSERSSVHILGAVLKVLVLQRLVVRFLLTSQ